MSATRKRFGRRFGWVRKNALGLVTALVVVLLLGAYAAVVANTRPSVSGDGLRYDTFATLAGQGRIEQATILDQDAYVVGTYRPTTATPSSGNAAGGAAPRHYSVAYLKAADSRGALLDLLVKDGVPTTIDQQFGKSLLAPVEILIPALVLATLLLYLILSYRRGAGVFGLPSGARRIEPGDASITFAEVAGQDAAVTELREITAFLADPGRFAALGATVPKGLLLFGPPGCGKTLLARAVAGEAGAAFYSISGSDFVEMYVGVGAARVRELFAQARENAPAIVFIDELDSVGRRRGGGAVSGGSRDEQEQALNQILAELDGFSPMAGIIVIGATNRPDTLDPALLRPGRFDRTIGLERPDEKGRLAILSVHAQRKSFQGDVDLTAIAAKAIGLSGADLASVMNEAALLTARAGQPAISQTQLDEALRRILEAPERQRRLSMRDRGFARAGAGESPVSFADVAGAEEAKAELAEVRDFLLEPARFTELGARPPRGFLLVGPPGCGKTLLARAVATEANASFFSVAATEFVEVFAGEGAARVRDLFAEARLAAPSVVFLDEIDAIGARRGASADGHREREQTLNQILVELDGFSARSGVLVMAASNRPEILDEALVRAGRFDRTITIHLPDRTGRSAILAIHARGKRLGPDVDLDMAAAMAQGFSGADLANVLNEAALLAARRRLALIPMALVEEAVERTGMGLARARSLSAEERAMVAYHEIGHALVGRSLPGAQSPHKVSVVARGHLLGVTWQAEEAERLVHPRSVLIGQMAGLLGGRAAEELVFGEPGSAAADDLARVARIARHMVCQLGMSTALGQLAYPDGTGADGRTAACSPETAALIDAEVRRVVDEAYQLATAVLTASRDALDRAAQALLERETLTAVQLDEIVGPLPATPARPVRHSGAGVPALATPVESWASGRR